MPQIIATKYPNVNHVPQNTTNISTAPENTYIVVFCAIEIICFVPYVLCHRNHMFCPIYSMYIYIYILYTMTYNIYKICHKIYISGCYNI